MPTFVRVLPILLFAAGCSGPPATQLHQQATYDSDALTTAAFAEYDRNKNGVLEGAELDSCPALKSALAGIDTNRDGKIAKDELRARFEAYATANAATVSVTGSVTLDGKALPDATVQFVPEAFMGNIVQEATGKTGADGTITSFTSGGQQYPGLQPGFYKVRVTRESGPALPARYNTQTTLGVEVFGGRGVKPLAFALVGR